MRCERSGRYRGTKHVSKSKCARPPQVLGTFGSSDVQSACRSGVKHISKSKCVEGLRFRALSEVQMFKNWWFQVVPEHFLRLGSVFAWQAQWILHLLQSESNAWVLAAVAKMMAGVGRLKMDFAQQAQSKRHIQQTSSDVMGDDFLKRIAFWMRS